MKRILSIILFLILCSSTAYAFGEQNVKIIHTDGSIEKINPQKNNKDNQPTANHTKVDTTTTQPVTQNETAQKEQAKDLLTSSVTGGIIGAASILCDNVLNSGFDMSGVTAQQKIVNNSKTLTYSLYSEEINPFKAPFVQSMLLITGALYYICWIIAVFLSLGIFGLQQMSPRFFSDIRESITGEEGYYDVFRMFETFGMWGGYPIGSFIVISMLIFLRNLIVASMTTQIIDSIGASSQSLPTYFILTIGYYFNIIQKVIAEYGAYLIVCMVFVIGLILGFATLFYSFKLAVRTAFFIALLFGLLLMVDIVTIFCIWFAVSMIAYTGNQGFAIAGVLSAFVVDALILLSPIIFLYFKLSSGKKLIAGVL